MGAVWPNRVSWLRMRRKMLSPYRAAVSEQIMWLPDTLLGEMK
jgi:hypothetical protein